MSIEWYLLDVRVQRTSLSMERSNCWRMCEGRAYRRVLFITMFSDRLNIDLLDLIGYDAN